MRAFIAVDPPEKTKAIIAGSFARRAETDADREKIHLTLLFLGDISQAQADAAAAGLRRLEIGSFRVSLCGAGSFSLSQQEVVFIKVSEGQEQLALLRELLLWPIKKAGIRIGKRAFAPHITVARIRNADRKRIAEDYVKMNADREFGSFMCTRISLKESIPHPGGYAYRDLSVTELHG